MAGALHALPEVVSTEVYAGTAAPYNFNGLVRHYFLRGGPHQGDVQVTLKAKGERRRSSHAIAKAARPLVVAVGRRYDARVKVAEVPPGPPVLQTLVAEIYGPDDAGRRDVARQVKDLFTTTPGVVDVDWYVESPREKAVYRLDREKAGLAGIREADAAAALRLALGDDAAGEVTLPDDARAHPARRHAPAGAPQRSRRALGSDGFGRGRPSRAALGDRALRAAAGGDLDLPQEPETRRLRHRRRRGREGGARLRHPGVREGALEDPRARRATGSRRKRRPRRSTRPATASSGTANGT